jgi:putative copper export protein
MKKALTIFIGFLHDFAAGCWAATVLAVYWVDRIASGRPELKPLFDTLEPRFFWAGVLYTVVVLLAVSGLGTWWWHLTMLGSGSFSRPILHRTG